MVRKVRRKYQDASVAPMIPVVKELEIKEEEITKIEEIIPEIMEDEESADLVIQNFLKDIEE